MTQKSSIWLFLWFMLTSIHVQSTIKVNRSKITSRVRSKISFFNFSRKRSIWGLKYIHTTYQNMHLAHILVCVSTLYLNQKLSYSLASIVAWARSKRAWFLEMSHWCRSLPESIWLFRVQKSELRWEIFRMTKFEQDYPQMPDYRELLWRVLFFFWMMLELMNVPTKIRGPCQGPDQSTV